MASESTVFGIFYPFLQFLPATRTGQFCDVRLVCDGMEIPAHKKVLAAASPYFFAMFASSNFVETHQEKVTIRGIDAQALQSLIEYVYTEHIDLTDDNVQVKESLFLQ